MESKYEIGIPLSLIVSEKSLIVSEISTFIFTFFKFVGGLWALKCTRTRLRNPNLRPNSLSLTVSEISALIRSKLRFFEVCGRKLWAS